MVNVMIDLETWGVAPGSALLSIGAVAFDPQGGDLGSKYYSVINLASCDAVGLTVDPATVDWWQNQEDQARAILYAEPTAPDLREVLEGFTEYLKVVSDREDDLKVWGNGADFDLVLTIAAYRALGMRQPWRFFNHRCYRTVKALAPDTRPVIGKVKHHALHDAVDQAMHLQGIVKSLGLKL